jgi:hypothetical protein
MPLEIFISALPHIVCALLAGFFCAVMDTLAHHWDSSVFMDKDTPFWNPLHKDNDKVKRIFGWPMDAWHIAKSLFLFCAFSVSFFDSMLNPYLQFGLIGVTFIASFNLFYNKILRLN